jgi:hypothetical protein
VSKNSRREARHERKAELVRQQKRERAILDFKIKHARRLKSGQQVLEELYSEVQRLRSWSKAAWIVRRTVRAIREAGRRVQHLAELREKGLLPRIKGGLK